MRSTPFGLAFVGALYSCALAQAQSASADLKPQQSPQAVVDEHMDALNACDVDRIMAQYPEDAQISPPDSGGIRGKSAIREAFTDLCKDRKDGGFKGTHFGVMSSKRVGDSIVIDWVATAPFLAAPAMGADAFITKDGLIQAMVTTLDPAVYFKVKKQ